MMNGGVFRSKASRKQLSPGLYSPDARFGSWAATILNPFDRVGRTSIGIADDPDWQVRLDACMVQR
jgi:hypothetical protein